MLDVTRQALTVAGICVALLCAQISRAALPHAVAQAAIDPSAVLAVEDLPAGWTAITTPMGAASIVDRVNEVTGCGLTLAPPAVTITGTGGAAFALPHGQLAETVDEEVLVLAGGAGRPLQAALSAALAAAVNPRAPAMAALVRPVR